MRDFPRPVFDANATGSGEFGDLPEWDLTDLYTAPDAPELSRDLQWLETEFARTSCICIKNRAGEVAHWGILLRALAQTYADGSTGTSLADAEASIELVKILWIVR